MMPPPLPISIFHYLLCSVGTIVNVLLIFIILRKTPRSLRIYSILMFSQTLLQTSTCFISGILFVRVIPSDMSAFFVISGPASFLKYYVILHSSSSFNSVVILTLIIYLPTPIIFVRLLFSAVAITIRLIVLLAMTAGYAWWFAQTPLFNEQTAKRLLLPKGPCYAFDDYEMVTGIPNVLYPSAITGIVWVCAPCVPAYTIILIVGRRMYQTLAANVTHMSERTRASHREIVKGLVFQACLPALYSLSVGTYVVGQLNILHLVPLEYITHIVGEICVASSPFMTLYFVQPYRRTLQRATSKRDTVVTISLVPSTHR